MIKLNAAVLLTLLLCAVPASAGSPRRLTGSDRPFTQCRQSDASEVTVMRRAATSCFLILACIATHDWALADTFAATNLCQNPSFENAAADRSANGPSRNRSPGRAAPS